MKTIPSTSSLILIASALGAAALVTSCGGSSGSSSSGSSSGSIAAKAATIDMSSVATGIPEVSAFIPICTTGPSTKQLAGAAAAPLSSLNWLMAAQDARQAKQAGALALKAYTSSKPADSLGSCGGRRTYPSYSHVNGVTTATLSYENYCTSNSATGGKSIINGSYSFVNTATPTASGPITSKFQSSSPVGLSFETRDAAGKVLTSQLFAYSNYVQTYGVPGGTATASNPDTLAVDELNVTDQVSAKTYRQSGYTLSTYSLPGGGSQTLMSGRSYRSSGDYFDFSTSKPLVTDSSGNTVSGEYSFTGAPGSVAVATMVPGATLQATLTVNGTPVTAVPSCK